MLQRGRRTADVTRAINCNVRTVRRLRRCYRVSGRTADHPLSGRPCVTTPARDWYIRTSHLRDRYRMATTAWVTPGMHNPSITAHTARNWLKEVGLRACRPVVRQVLNQTSPAKTTCLDMFANVLKNEREISDLHKYSPEPIHGRIIFCSNYSWESFWVIL
jgi:hypothetical protein